MALRGEADWLGTDRLSGFVVKEKERTVENRDSRSPDDLTAKEKKGDTMLGQHWPNMGHPLRGEK